MEDKNDVKLYIYDLSQGMANLMSAALLGHHIEGIWHTAVVVFGKEYFYGATGIQFCEPGGTVLGQPLKIEKLGDTSVPYGIFKDYLRGLSDSTFKGSRYNLLQHNCNTFSEDLSQFLCGIGIPKYIIDLPQNILSTPIGQAFSPLLDSLYNNSEHFAFEPRVESGRDTSPDLEDLNNQIEEARLHSLALDEQRRKIQEKIAKKEKKEKKSKKQKNLSTPDDSNSNMSEQNNGSEIPRNGNNGNISDEILDNAARESFEEERKHREPPVVFKDIDPKVELDELVRLLDGKISKEEEGSVEELHQYLIEDEGSWTLSDNFLVFVKRVLEDPSLAQDSKVRLIRVLACAALKDDIVLLLHQDRRDHVLTNYSQDIDKHTLEEQQAWGLFICNLFENVSSSEWLLYISEWAYNNQQISNIRATTKVAVHCLLAADKTLQDIGSSIMHNLGIMEVKTVVFDDVAVELTMAILQFFNSKAEEEQIFRTLKALHRFVMTSPDVGQFVQMIGPHPVIFKGSSKRVDELVTEITKKVPVP
ncbi:uncharacterized protein LOC129607214 isoform X2 [Condylostylus longicornis]|uniref:uncharacterized protein LOC129607214 isoform X2 n=1 Tax=Condylostylus longicornis TaxID=2530218 RepID=UPI00244DEAA8|nr:uncharacterized protein LOC129607214 isoform X2 [Condylostylus longicornis]